jgi:hypothetical protein
MAKKKKKSAPKKVVAKAPKKKLIANAAKKKASAKKSVKKKIGRKAPVKRASATLGRPLVTGEEKLYLLFKEDYHARQVFDFLRVETVKDLEQFTPQDIVHILSKPIRQTVDGIRRRLAEKNRCLSGDEEFALRQRSGDNEGRG